MVVAIRVQLQLFRCSDSWTGSCSLNSSSCFSATGFINLNSFVVCFCRSGEGLNWKIPPLFGRVENLAGDFFDFPRRNQNQDGSLILNGDKGQEVDK